MIQLFKYRTAVIENNIYNMETADGLRSNPSVFKTDSLHCFAVEKF